MRLKPSRYLARALAELVKARNVLEKDEKQEGYWCDVVDLIDDSIRVARSLRKAGQ